MTQHQLLLGQMLNLIVSDVEPHFVSDVEPHIVSDVQPHIVDEIEAIPPPLNV